METVILDVQVKVKILKSHYMKLGSELDIQSFDDLWKVEVSNSAKMFETMSFQDSHSNGMLVQSTTLAEVSHVVMVIKTTKLQDQMVLFAN